MLPPRMRHMRCSRKFLPLHHKPHFLGLGRMLFNRSEIHQRILLAVNINAPHLVLVPFPVVVRVAPYM